MSEEEVEIYTEPRFRKPPVVPTAGEVTNFIGGVLILAGVVGKWGWLWGLIGFGIWMFIAGWGMILEEKKKDAKL